jgi:hypothetical protein
VAEALDNEVLGVVGPLGLSRGVSGGVGGAGAGGSGWGGFGVEGSGMGCSGAPASQTKMIILVSSQRAIMLKWPELNFMLRSR